MQLGPSDRAKLMDTIAASFVSYEIEAILDSRFDLAYRNIAAAELPDVVRAMKLTQYFQMRNHAERLVAALRDARPDVPAFAELAEAVGLIRLPEAAALQVLTRPSTGTSIGQDPAAFRMALAKCEDTICRIVIGGTRYGTGMLVGPDLVLTNYHVVARALGEGGALTQPVGCQFDYRQAANGYLTPASPVDAVAVVASSSYAPEDLTGLVNPSTALLDYAVLRLARDMAAPPIIPGGLPRGFTALPASPPVPQLQQGILLLQHPNADPLRLDLGAVSWVGDTRVRHTASTLGGSSGAPVFDADLAPVALHHAGYDWPNAERAVNQAIPLALVAADARRRGVAL